MQVRIISPTKAKEMNKYGEEPPYTKNYPYSYDIYRYLLKKWQAAELACKTYKIEKCGININCDMSNHDKCPCQIIGSIHEAELLESGMIKIID